jgi:hypothetical protein
MESPTFAFQEVPTIRLNGRVFPCHIPITLKTTLVPAINIITQGTPLDGLEVMFQFAIQDSRVQVACHVNRILPTDFGFIFTSAFEVVRAAVDLMAFSIGKGLTLILETAHYPDGSIVKISHSDPALPPLCTAYKIDESGSDQSAGIVLREILNDRNIMTALHDLTATMEAPSTIPSNCFRAIESVCRAIGQKGKPPKVWGGLRDSLNVSYDYVYPIDEDSKNSRHGNHSDPRYLTDHEIRLRAWNIMNRFMEFRKRGNVPLTDLPLLDDQPPRKYRSSFSKPDQPLR